MLRWNWKKIIGEIVYEGGTPYDKKRLYQGNCLAVVGSFCDPRPDNDLTEPGWCVYGEFWNDLDHLKNLLGLNPKGGFGDNLYSNVQKVRLNTFYRDGDPKEFDAMCKLFVKAHVTLELYYEPYKEDAE